MIFHCRADFAGRFISRGCGRHVARIIDSWELILVLESTLHMFVGPEEFSVPAGKCLLLPPGVRHGGLSPYPSALSFFWIHFYPRNRPTGEKLKSLPVCFQPVNPARLSEFFQIYLSLQEEAKPDRTGLELMLSLILHEACCRDDAAEEMRSLPPLVEKAVNIQTLRFREPLSTSQLAAELQCNPDYLGRIYKKYRRESITAALNRIRLKHAAALLRDSSLTVSQIAYETGFNDPGYFRRCFFRKFALSPRAFRDLKRQGHVNTE